jgi:hypothetical protein
MRMTMSLAGARIPMTAVIVRATGMGERNRRHRQKGQQYAQYLDVK